MSRKLITKSSITWPFSSRKSTRYWANTNLMTWAPSKWANTNGCLTPNLNQRRASKYFWMISTSFDNTFPHGRSLIFNTFTPRSSSFLRGSTNYSKYIRIISTRFICTRRRYRAWRIRLRAWRQVMPKNQCLKWCRSIWPLRSFQRRKFNNWFYLITSIKIRRLRTRSLRSKLMHKLMPRITSKIVKHLVKRMT